MQSPPIDAKLFYKGYFTDWSPILGNLDVRRSVIDPILVESVLPDEEERQGSLQSLVVLLVNAGVIPGGRIATVFNASGRTSTLGTSGEAGTGFGLPLARKFAELMRARLEVQSNEQTQSTTVSLVIPTCRRRSADGVFHAAQQAAGG